MQKLKKKKKKTNDAIWVSWTHGKNSHLGIQMP